MTAVTAAPTPYKDAAHTYLDAGWTGILPLPPQQKGNPPTGYTGANGTWPDTNQIDQWVTTHSHGNIGLRMPADIIGIDIDHYGNKTGGDTLQQLTNKWGPLPATWISTSRHDGISGIRFYRIPEPTRLIGALPGIEIIQRHHRYAVVAPSIHPENRRYTWIDPDGQEADVAYTEDLPMLPPAWLEGLRVDNKAARQIRAARTGGHTTSPAVDKTLGRAISEMRVGTRHDAALDAVTTLARLEEREHPGASQAIDQLGDIFINAITPDRGEQQAQAEWRRMRDSARNLVATTPAHITKWEHRDDPTDLDDILGDNLKTGATTPPGPDTPWPDPIPLGADTQLPPFPTQILPDWIANFAQEVADDLQTPIDLPALLAIGAISTLAAGHVKVNVRGRWNEHTNLYIAIAMPPSTGKSPAYKAMCGPVTQLEQEHQRLVRADIAANADMVEALEAELKRTRQLADVKQESLAEIRARIFEAQEKPTTLPKFTVGDATPEALAKLIADNGGRMAVHSTEGGVFDLMAGRYSDRANLDVYLQGWSGDELDTARIGREANHAEEAILTMLLTVQPSVIAALADTPELAGKGLTARFMYSIPADTLGHRDLTLRPPAPAHIQDTYNQQLLTLGRQFLSWDTPATIHLSPDAAAHYTDWRQSLETRRTIDGDLRSMAEWTGKLESSVLRVAGLLHLAHGATHSDPIDTVTMAQAITLGTYWLAHAAHVHDIWGTSPDLQQARAILEWARAKHLTEFTVRDLYAGNRARFRKADDTLPPLELLHERGWVRTTDGGPITTQRNRRSVEFALHPELSTSSARSARSARRDKKSSLSLSKNTGAPTGTPAQNAQNAQNNETSPLDAQNAQNPKPVDNSTGPGPTPDPAPTAPTDTPDPTTPDPAPTAPIDLDDLF